MFASRVEKVKGELKKAGLDAVFISTPATITYLTGYSNFPIAERDAFLLIAKEGNYLLTHSIYSAVLEGKIPGFQVVEVSRRQPPKKILLELLKRKTAKLGIEENDLTAAEYKSLLKIFKNVKNF
ncbi:MAG: aminopeptidase P family N-terminal domain-containing protein [Patescibacteria group bacterium]|nr:aminopeptidase P family N-terminal domain-containing protein [Patescibacteria group bacterium]